MEIIAAQGKGRGTRSRAGPVVLSDTGCPIWMSAGWFSLMNGPTNNDTSAPARRGQRRIGHGSDDAMV
jgi:hypothetical protein